MITSISFVILSLIYNSILTIIFFKKSHIESREINIYKGLLISNLIGLLLELGSFYSLYFLGVNNLTIIINKFFLIYYIIFILLFSSYIIHIAIDLKYQEKINKSFKIIGSAMLLILSIFIFILNIEFNIGAHIYSKGPAVDLIYTFMTIVLIVILTIFIIRFKYLDKKKLIPCLVFIFGCGIVGIIQKYYPYITLSTSMEAIVLLTMYFTIENPDVKMLKNMTMLKEQADKANNAKSEFLSNMSHEIRTPLNAIVGFSESLKEDNLPEESKEKVEDIIMASNNLLEIVNGILDISKIEANKLEIIEKEYEIDELWEELIILTKARIGDRGIDFRVNIDPTIPKVLYGDNTRLKQVVLNILTNAAKYTKEGFIEFTVSSIIKNDIVRLIISVEDSGIGIKEESLPRLFSKFDRLSVEKSLTIEGTGLGLAITKKLVELMHGKIIVQSIYGKGSKFTISIDQKIISNTVEHQKETTESSSKIIDLKDAKVLIVDDNELNIKVATTLLKKYNLNIESCISGFECIEKINNGNTYDLIFLDDMMPKMSGKETLAKLNNINGFNIPVIALTANAIEGMKEDYLKSGFTDYLSKPIVKNDLEKVLRTYISKKNNTNTNSTSTDNHTSIIADSLLLTEPDIKSEPTKKKKKKKKKKNNNNTEQVNNSTNNKGYILVVDDNDINLKVATRLIGKYVSKLDTAKSGSEAIEKVIENKYDIIFMDDMMPNLDGPTTLDNLRDIDGFNIPTILMTANELDATIEEKMNKHGFSDYLSKPIDNEKLTKILTKYIK